jgi:hypothetical protein
VFCAGILNIVIKLPELMKELKLIRPKGIQALRLDLASWGLSLISTCNLFHGHQDFIDSSDILLNFRDVMLQHSQLDSLCRPKSLHDGSVFVSNIFLDNSFN